MRNISEIKKKILNLSNGRNCSLHEPLLDNADILEVNKCIKSSYVSTVGEYVNKFEKKLSSFTKSNYVIATNSGTSALHIALKISGVKKDTNVILPTLSFVATANAVLYNQAEPIFIDSSIENFSLCHLSLKKFFENETYTYKKKRYAKHNKKIISAIIPVHVFGSCCVIDEIIKIGKKYNVSVIEDCAEGLASYYKKKHLGTFGKVGILSFNGNKIITSGSGGAIITNSKKLYKKALHLVSVSKIKHKWRFRHNKLGWNYRMSSLSAALGYSQLLKIRDILSKKRRLKDFYKNLFRNNKNFEFINYRKIKYLNSNYWLNAIKIINKKISRDQVLNYLNDSGIFARPIWDLLHTLPMYKKFKSYKIKNSKKLEKEIIFLPSSPGLIK